MHTMCTIDKLCGNGLILNISRTRFQIVFNGRALCTPPRFLFTYTLVTISSDFYLTLQGIIIALIAHLRN